MDLSPLQNIFHFYFMSDPHPPPSTLSPRPKNKKKKKEKGSPGGARHEIWAMASRCLNNSPRGKEEGISARGVEKIVSFQGF